MAAGLIMGFISEKMTASIWNDAALGKVAITKHEEVVRDNTAIILGTVENHSTKIFRVLTVQVDLFDKNGRFVDQCKDHPSGAFKPGESRNLKVSCWSNKDKSTVQHETYKVRVLD